MTKSIRRPWKLSVNAVVTFIEKSPVILDTYYLETPCSRAVIGLHGIGGDEQSLLPVATAVRSRKAKWYLPRGPHAAAQGGYAWYDGDEVSVWDDRLALKLLEELREQLETKGYPPERQFLLGFSMGACLALEYALRLPLALGGVVAMAGFIRDTFQHQRTHPDPGSATPILLLHGRRDTVVNWKAGRQAAVRISAAGHPTRLELHDAGHKFPLKLASLVRDFIEEPAAVVKRPGNRSRL